MASPHVAGLAAISRFPNPDFTYQDVVTAIKAGGDDVSVLANKTMTGMGTDAVGSLTCIQPSAGISVAADLTIMMPAMTASWPEQQEHAGR